MARAPETAIGGHLAENIVYFARALRKAGMRVGPASVKEAIEAQADVTEAQQAGAGQAILKELAVAGEPGRPPADSQQQQVQTGEQESRPGLAPAGWAAAGGLDADAPGPHRQGLALEGTPSSEIPPLHGMGRMEDRPVLLRRQVEVGKKVASF